MCPPCLGGRRGRGAEELLAFATSAIREAPNGDDVLAAVRVATGVDLEVLAVTTRRGSPSSRYAVVRLVAGRLLVLDIGGGSLELATGIDEVPDAPTRCRWAPAG